MKIGLIDVDSHAKKKKWGATIYPNLALSKISSYHKSIGNSVEWYDGMFGGEYDIVYVSKIFNFTKDYEYPIRAKQVVKGGTGYNLHSALPDYIDNVQPDFTIYPNVPTDTAYGFLTRGCPNKCPWCVVPIKEGKIRPYWDIEKVTNGRQNAVLMDNNILASGDYCMEQLEKIIALNLKVDFNQALDARLVNEDNAKLLANIRWIRSRIRFGCDTEKQIGDCERAMNLISSYGYKGEYFLYTMIGLKGSDLHECYNRIMYWWFKNQHKIKTKEGNAVYPYAQPYRDPERPNTPPQWQLDMARWCNKKAIFATCKFEDYQPRKGFKCEKYLKQ